MSARLIDLVWEVLRKHPETRSNDKLLFLNVWGKQEFKLTEKQIKHFLKWCSSPDLISRYRRKIQADGFFKAKKLTQAKRTLLKMKYRDKFSRGKAGAT